MSMISKRAVALREARLTDLRNAYPTLLKRPALLPRPDRTALILGRDENAKPVALPVKARLEHTHVIGTTGGGKTKLLEHCARQDIIDGRGVCIVDAHGNHPDSLYRSMLSWLDERDYTKTRTVHLIDPNAATHVTGLNPLALPSPDYDSTVIAEAMQEALERVWGEEDLNAKPTLQRVLSAVLTTLTELGLTLAEARLLFDPHDRHGVRAWAIANLKDQEAREELEWLHEIAAEPRGRQDFRLEATGPRNRLSKLTRVQAIRTMVGQQERTLDFRAALDDGHIILANLSPGPRASDKATQLLGRLLTRMLFFHAVRRQNPERPFFFYLDECQLYLSGDVSRLLSESRKYGVGCILSHQFLAQFEIAGLDVLEAVKNTTNLKVVLRIKNPEEAAELADMVLRYDLEMPVQALTKPTVVGHRLVKLKSESVSEQTAVSEMQTDTVGHSYTESYSSTDSTAETVGEAMSLGEGDAVSSATGASNASTSGSGEATGITNTVTVGTDIFGLPTVIGVAEGESASSHRAEMSGSNSSRGRSSSNSRSRSSSQAKTLSSSTSESVAYTTSSSRSIGRAETKGEALTHGAQEAFEPIYENRPSAVHGLENLRYMAATVLRNLTAGRAAVSFVNADGMKTASLTVANVESRALAPAEFEALRVRVLDASPSATRTDLAIANVAAREQALIAEAGEAATQIEPATPAGYRVKKERPARVSVQEVRRVHGKQTAAGRAPSQGSRSPKATAVGRP
jgi:Type IV secretion-system coupling protein DNA-binding domain